jgi:subtilisin family serine protease
LQEAAQMRDVIVFVLDSEFYSLDGHGRIVIEAIKENFTGEIKPIDVGDIQSEQLSIQSAIHALLEVEKYASEHPTMGIVVNMSWGTYYSNPELEKFFRELRDDGIVLVAAAGNDSNFTCRYPANYTDSVVAVGSVIEPIDDRGRRRLYAYELAPYSNHGYCVAIYGVDPTGEKLQRLIQKYEDPLIQEITAESQKKEDIKEALKNMGTSFTSPLVAGVLAQMLSVNRNLPADEAIRILKETSIKSTDPSIKILSEYAAIARAKAYVKSK